MKLSIIGCGNVAKTIAYLLYEAGTVEILDILNRTQKSAKSAVSFIGAGTVVSSYESLRPANIFVIGCNDDQISHCVEKLINQQIIESDTVIFHFSGAKSSIVLNEVKN